MSQSPSIPTTGAGRTGSPKTRGIPFSPAMVAALLAGQKTVTRRIAKTHANQMHIGRPLGDWPLSEFCGVSDGVATWKIQTAVDDTTTEAICCPYGAVSDLLYVREAYYQRGHWEPVALARTKKGRQKWAFIPADHVVLFDAPSVFRKGRHHKDPYTLAWHKRLGRFMPRAYSRITLEITSIRVERVQDITEEDARAEGVTPFPYDPEGDCWTAAPPSQKHRTAFNYLWGEINGWDGAGSWVANPWVWVVAFRVLPTGGSR